jgi:HK97 family phage major capsid protein
MQERIRPVHQTRAKDALNGYFATLSDQVGPSGAYLHAPETLRRELEINLLWYGGMRQVAETIRTETGERLSWPTVDDTGNQAVQLSENTAVTTTVDPAFAKVYWDAYKYSSDAVLVPYELLQDSVFDLPRILGELLGVRLGRKTNKDFTTGTGASMPMGIKTKLLQSSSFFKLTANVAQITFDDIIDLVHAVDVAYRMQNPGWLLHDLLVAYVRKLKDGIGRYLWQSNQEIGQPDRLLGYPVQINNDMDSTVTTGNACLIFGALSHYKIRSVGQVRMYRLQERYRDLDQDAFLAFMREDGNLLTAGTAPCKALKIS